jgi:SAM-dependent methyltransferase
MQERDWDRVAASFDAEIFNVPANDRKGLIAEHIQRLGGKHRVAADLGCGIGRTLPLLADHFGTVIGVDISRKCLALAARKFIDTPNIRFVHADLTKHAGVEKPVDLVLCINTWLSAHPAKREALIGHTCSAVAKGGHLLLVVPALESALLTTHVMVRWNKRTGMSASTAERSAGPGHPGLFAGLVELDGVPTKHYLREELQQLLGEQGVHMREAVKIEYPWATEFSRPPRWMGPPYPWDWLVLAQR